MRSILLIFATLVLIAGGFFAYLWFQPAGANNASTVGTSTTAPMALVPASRPTETPDPNVIGGGGTSTNIYIKTIDEKTGQLSNEFRAAKFEPRKDGTVDVTEPEGKFYLAKSDSGQVLVIRGKTGKVVVPDSANNRSRLKGASTAAPTRGQLQDVTVLVYETPSAPEPILTCTMNNASFDQETFRIQTESYEHNGKIIPADQVAVQVRGRDYDFDGRGLDIRWNERDRRLQELEVAHGEQLTVKHPQAMQALGTPTTAPSAMNRAFLPLAASRINALPSARMQAINLAGMLASADPASAGEVIPPAPLPAPVRKKRKPATAPAVAPVKIVRDKTAPIFRASFMDNVKIVQADATLATANLMNVDFVMESSKASTQPSTAPADASSTKPAAKGNSAEPKSLATVVRNTKPKPTTAPATPTIAASTVATPAGATAAGATPTIAPPTTVALERKRPKHAEPTSSASATTSPTTQPEEQPITIYWTGKLRVTPLDAETQDPPTHEDSIVTMEGEPVILKRGDGTVECSLMRYHTQNSSVLMESSKATPAVVMKDATGSVLRTPSVDYDGPEGIAILRGPSQADLVARNESTTQPSAAATIQPQMMHASWTKSCRLLVSGDGRQNMSIERAEIDGDVTVDHPQVKGRSDTLELSFEKAPSTRPAAVASSSPGGDLALKQLDAEGKVHYVLTNEQQKSQTINCEHLELLTGRDQNNKTYASAMNADGSVHAFDDTQDMTCGQLAVKFLPSTRPSTQPADGKKFDTASIEVDSLTAQQDVKVATQDGNSATANSLVVETKDGKHEVTLFGAPARVQQKDNLLAGPIIKFDPESNRAYVVGAGTMHAVQVAQNATDKNADKKAKPQPMDLSWAGNLSADGAQNLIDITEKISITAKTSDGANNNASSDRLKLTLMDDPKAATRPATQRVKKDKASPMASAGFGQADFFKDKLVKTVRLEQNVALASVLNDAAGQLLRRFYMRAATVQYEMQDKIFLVPVPGQMLMQDLSKPDNSAADVTSDATPSDMHGATAFEWQRELRYDEGAHRVTMSGGVHIEHESGSDSKPFTLRCQTIIADLEPAPTTAPTTSPTNAPATAPAAQVTPSVNQKMRLSHVTAADQVEFISLPVHFEAASIDYDPNTHMLIAKGTDRVRAQLYDEKGSVKGSFTELWYNTQTGRVDRTLGFRTTVRGKTT